MDPGFLQCCICCMCRFVFDRTPLPTQESIEDGLRWQGGGEGTCPKTCEDYTPLGCSLGLEDEILEELIATYACLSRCLLRNRCVSYVTGTPLVDSEFTLKKYNRAGKEPMCHWADKPGANPDRLIDKLFRGRCQHSRAFGSMDRLPES